MRRNLRSALLAAFALVAGVAIVGYSPSGDVQAAAPAKAADPAGDLRAMNAGVLEVAEGKKVAEAVCARCHGANGISTTAGVPHLAGQRAAYLYIEMRAYQAGLRADKTMDAAVKHMNNDALVNAAAYYASMDPPPSTPITNPTPKPDPVEAGKAAATPCGACHGVSGTSKMPSMPNLAGFDPKYLVASMQAYKSGQRKHEMMKTLIAPVTEPDMNNIALYYALQIPGRAQTPAPGDAAAGKAAAGNCAACHGEGGVSANPVMPSIAGQDATYFAAAVKAYKDGSRSDPTMKAVVSPLDATTVQNLAAYYAAQEPKQPKVRKPLTIVEHTQRCDRCHGINGNSTDPRAPALASQRVDYLEKVLIAYRKGERKHTTMAAMASGLTDAEIEQLAAHYAGQKARAVVFITQPRN